MNRLLVSCALAAILSGAVGLSSPAFAQGTPPGPPAAGAADHAKLEAAIQQLDLTPRQKIEIARIVKKAKDSGQDKKVTAEQVGQVLTPQQKAKLVDMLKAQEAKK